MNPNTATEAWKPSMEFSAEMTRDFFVAVESANGYCGLSIKPAEGVIVYIANENVRPAIEKIFAMNPHIQGRAEVMG